MADVIDNMSPEEINAGIVDTETQLRIERFLAYEAALLDGHHYDRWMTLWLNEDILYGVPCNDDDQDPMSGIAIIYDDRTRLDERIVRLKDKTAHAYRPRARLSRNISAVVPVKKEGDELEVVSTFVIGEIRTGIQNHWYGRSIHRLAHTADGYKMRQKKVILLNNDEPMPNLTFLVYFALQGFVRSPGIMINRIRYELRSLCESRDRLYNRRRLCLLTYVRSL